MALDDDDALYDVWFNSSHMILKCKKTLRKLICYRDSIAKDKEVLKNKLVTLKKKSICIFILIRNYSLNFGHNTLKKSRPESYNYTQNHLA